jgi:putative transposase
VLERVGSFAAFLGTAFDQDAAFAALRRSETTGRPIGSQDWIRRLERDLARPLAPRKRGPKPREPARTAQDDLFRKLSCMDGPCVARMN